MKVFNIVIMILLLGGCSCPKKETQHCSDDKKKIDELNQDVKALKNRVLKLEQTIQKVDDLKFNYEQVSKGLVYYNNQWMTKAQKQKMIDEKEKRQKQYTLKKSKPVHSTGKGLVKYQGRWMTPKERLELENKVKQ